MSRGRGHPPASLAWLVWGLGAALYLIAFYQRVAPAVLVQELTREFSLTGAALGNLSAFYFYSYVAMQIPTGLIADRWGPRKLLTAGAALTAAGTLVFALAPTAHVANAGRLAIGAAAGVAFVAMLKLASHWMPSRAVRAGERRGALRGRGGRDPRGRAASPRSWTPWAGET